MPSLLVSFQALSPLHHHWPRRCCYHLSSSCPSYASFWIFLPHCRILHWMIPSSFSFSSWGFPLLHSQTRNHLLEHSWIPFWTSFEDFHPRYRICYSCVWSASFWQPFHPHFHHLHPRSLLSSCASW